MFGFLWEKGGMEEHGAGAADEGARCVVVPEGPVSCSSQSVELGERGRP